MKRWMIAPGLLAMSLASGCESMSNTAKGGLVGGGLGAGLGAIAGSASGHAGGGAAIGAAAGTVLGAIVGNDADQQDKKRAEERIAVAEARQVQPLQPVVQAPLGITDVMQMTREGIHEDIIINQIRSTNSTFQLSNEDVRALSQNGVSPRVVIEMQNRRPVTRVMHQQQVIYQQAPPPTVIYTRPYCYAPPPPPVIGVYGRFR